MEKPNYDCIAYDSGNELEDLKQYKIDLEKYAEYEINRLKSELKNHKDLHHVSVCSWDKICIVKTKKNNCRKNCKYDTRKL